MRKRLLLLAGAALAATAAATPARAFGLRTHLYIADQVWQDLADCRVSIRGADFAIPAEACRAIRGHRGEFLAGALGPDVFPDVLVGQAIVHPGVAQPAALERPHRRSAGLRLGLCDAFRGRHLRS